MAAGMCADVCIHDVDGTNPHAHVLLTMRPFNEDRSWGDKQKKVYHLDEQGNKIYDPVKRQYACNKIQTTDWHEHSRAEEWREAWAVCANAYLERGGHEKRLDHRSYERQGLEQIPTIHLGAAAFQMERRGIRTERGDINRAIEVSNKRLREIGARLDELQKWLLEEKANTDTPTLADIIQSIAQRRGGIYGLDDMVELCTANNIMDMAGLDDCFGGMIKERVRIGNELKPIEKRLELLDEHIKQSGIYQQYHSHKTKYDKLKAEHKKLSKETGFGAKRKAQNALDAANHYHETNRMEITLCTAAERHLKAHKNSEGKIPLPDWKAEREKLTAERNKLNARYQKLKTETAKVEKIRSNIYSVTSADRRREQPQRSHSMEL